MDWCRKHMCDLSVVCKKWSGEPSLSTAQRSHFAETYNFVKQFSSFLHADDDPNITKSIAMTCTACKCAFNHECNGRQEWQQYCLLVQTS